MTFHRFAKGDKRRNPGEMSKPEAAYARVLEARQGCGQVAWFGYEAITLKLADNTRYTPDFAVMLEDGTLEAHEVKGGKKTKDGQRTFWAEDDAKLKIKVAAELFPIKFCIVYPIPGGSWGRKDF